MLYILNTEGFPSPVLGKLGSFKVHFGYVALSMDDCILV